MLAEETAGDSFCFVTFYDLPYGPGALHRNVLLCKKKQIITTEWRNASPAACDLKKGGELECWAACALHSAGQWHTTSGSRTYCTVSEGAVPLSHVAQLGRKTVVHGPSCLHTASLCSVQDSCGQAAMLAPSVLASKVETGSSPLDEGQSLQPWKLQPLQPEGQHATSRKAIQIGSRQEAILCVCEPGLSFKCVCVCI